MKTFLSPSAMAASTFLLLVLTPTWIGNLSGATGQTNGVVLGGRRDVTARTIPGSDLLAFGISMALVSSLLWIVVGTWAYSVATSQFLEKREPESPGGEEEQRNLATLVQLTQVFKMFKRLKDYYSGLKPPNKRGLLGKLMRREYAAIENEDWRDLLSRVGVWFGFIATVVDVNDFFNAFSD